MHTPNLSFTRRQVLAASAAAAVAPTMLTGRSWAQAKANNQIGVMLIGAGKRSAPLINQIIGDERLRLRAVAEVSTARREHVTAGVNKRYNSNDCKSVNDYRDLLDDDSIDAVCIVTPDHWHTLPAMQAALLGKHVYAEKPLTLNLHESQVLMAAQRKTGIAFQTGSQQRTEFGGKFATACEYVINGRLGKCERVECGSGDPAEPCNLPTEQPDDGLDWDLWQGQAPERGYHPDLCPRGVHNHFPNFRWYQEYAGGKLADWGAHVFDIAQWGLQKDRESPVKVIPPKDENAKRGCELVYADGKTIVHSTNQHSTKFIGDKGTITVSRGRLTSEPASILEEPLTDKDTRLHRTKGNHMTNFADCIGTDKQPVCDVEVGARVSNLCHLANIAYDIREELHFDGKAMKFTNSEAANNNVKVNCERREGFELPEIA